MRVTIFSGGAIAVLAACLWLTGCGSQSPPAEQSSEAAHDHAAGDQDHGHPTEGPHGGYLIELGSEEYHAELLHDDKTGTVTVYLLDGPAKEPVAIAESEITLRFLQDGEFVKYAFKAASASGADGSSSQFEIVDADLCRALRDEDHLQGRLQVTIDGKPYTGTIEHSSHDHDKDDHGHDDDGDHDH